MRALVLVAATLLLLGCASSPPYSARLVAPNGHEVMAMEGATYEIEFLNATMQNVGLTVSVDGLDVQSGQPMGWSRAAILERGGYVVDANTIVRLTGFPVSASRLSSFRFVDATHAYATSRHAAPRDLGKIEIGIYALRVRTPYLGPGQYAAPTITPPSGSATATIFGQLITDTYRSDDDHEQDPDRELGHLVLSYGGPARLGTAGPPPVAAPPPPVMASEQKPAKGDKPSRKKHIKDWPPKG